MVILREVYIFAIVQKLLWTILLPIEHKVVLAALPPSILNPPKKKMYLIYYDESYHLIFTK